MLHFVVLLNKDRLPRIIIFVSFISIELPQLIYRIVFEPAVMWNLKNCCVILWIFSFFFFTLDSVGLRYVLRLERGFRRYIEVLN